MTKDRDTWPELVYRFVEHYRWEPQHLGPTTAAFNRKIRSQEVPLNFLFNLLLHALPNEIRRSALRLNEQDLPVRVLVPQLADFTQPDVQLESENERIFVELKVRAATNLEQAQKYGLLLASLRGSDVHPKQSSLIYITRREFQRHWSPPRNAPTSGSELISQLQNAELSERLGRNRSARALEDSYRALLPSLHVAFMTWQEIGDHLREITSHAPLIAQDFIAGFLQDLSGRDLWQGGT